MLHRVSFHGSFPEKKLYIPKLETSSLSKSGLGHYNIFIHAIIFIRTIRIANEGMTDCFCHSKGIY